MDDKVKAIADDEEAPVTLMVVLTLAACSISPAPIQVIRLLHLQQYYGGDSATSVVNG